MTPHPSLNPHPSGASRTPSAGGSEQQSPPKIEHLRLSISNDPNRNVDDNDEICMSATDSAFGGVDEDLFRVDFLKELPDEIAVHVLSFLPDREALLLAAQVSSRWALISRDDSLWRRLFLARWQLPTPFRTEPHSILPKPQSNPSLDRPSHLPIQQVPWKSLYIYRQNLPSYTGHDDAVYCIQFDPYWIVSGSRDRSIKIWDHRDQSCTRETRGHSGSVLCLQYDDRQIVTGSSDSTIRIWDAATGACTAILRGHANPVLDVRFNRNLIVSCSKDCTIKVWNRTTGALIRSLDGHHAAVNAVHMHGDHVVSASGDCIVKMWDLATGALVRDFVGHTRGLACVQFDGKLVVSGSNDKTIRVWNAATGACLRVLEGHTELVRTLCFDGKRIVSGSYDLTIKVWDIETGAMLHSLERVHTSWIFHVQMDASKIISASQVISMACFLFGDVDESSTHFFPELQSGTLVTTFPTQAIFDSFYS
ncbi:WD40-repeat-containing domain protein [Zopfochytrium polystomum]|nr:WD40-repeat-containing domain protein [Zopfochytrium polystomum]